LKTVSVYSASKSSHVSYEWPKRTLHFLGICRCVRLAQPRDGNPKQRINMKTKQSNQVWVVVEVQSGIPVLAEVFAKKIAAQRLERQLRRDLRQDYDAAGIFE